MRLSKHLWALIQVGPKRIFLVNFLFGLSPDGPRTCPRLVQSRAVAPAWGCEARLELGAAGSVNRLKASRVRHLFAFQFGYLGLFLTGSSHSRLASGNLSGVWSVPGASWDSREPPQASRMAWMARSLSPMHRNATSVALEPIGRFGAGGAGAGVGLELKEIRLRKEATAWSPRSHTARFL